MCSAEEGGVGDRDDGDDDTVKTERRAKDFDDQHLEEQLALLCIADCSATSRNADRNAAANVANACGETGAKHAEASVVHRRRVRELLRSLDVELQNDGHDDSVDSNGLAEQNADQMLRAIRSLDARSNKTCARHINTPMYVCILSVNIKKGSMKKCVV